MRLYTYDSLYNLSKDRFLELKHHCAQYPEWQKWRHRNEFFSPPEYWGQFDPTGRMARENKWLDDQMKPIDETLAEMYPEPLTESAMEERRILKDAIFLPEHKKPDTVTFQYRKFFWLLDKKL